MNKKVILAFVLVLTLFLSFSCTLDNVVQFMDKMGKNSMGTVVYEVEVKAENQSSEKVKEDNPNLHKLMEAAGASSIVSAIPEDVKVQLVQNLSSEEGKKKLEALKETPADLGATPEEQKAMKEAISGTASIVNNYLKDAKAETGNEDLDKLITSMKDSFGKLADANKPESEATITKGDVIGLQSTVELLDKVANAIPEDKPVTIPKFDEAGNETGETKEVTSATLINTLLQKEGADTLSESELQEVLKNEDGQKALANVAAAAQDYVNLVGAATTFTGGVDVSGLLSSFLGSGSSSGSASPAPAPEEN